MKKKYPQNNHAHACIHGIIPNDTDIRTPPSDRYLFSSRLLSRRTTVVVGSSLLGLAPGAFAADTVAPSAVPHSHETQHVRPARQNVAPAAPDQVAPSPARPEVISVSRHRLSPASRAESRLASIPGATSVIDAQKVLKGRNFTNADALSFQPGVFAQSSGGGMVYACQFAGRALPPAPITSAPACL